MCVCVCIVVCLRLKAFQVTQLWPMEVASGKREPAHFALLWCSCTVLQLLSPVCPVRVSVIGLAGLGGKMVPPQPLPGLAPATIDHERPFGKTVVLHRVCRRSCGEDNNTTHFDLLSPWPTIFFLLPVLWMWNREQLIRCCWRLLHLAFGIWLVLISETERISGR